MIWVGVTFAALIVGFLAVNVAYAEGYRRGRHDGFRTAYRSHE